MPKLRPLGIGATKETNTLDIDTGPPAGQTLTTMPMRPARAPA